MTEQFKFKTHPLFKHAILRFLLNLKAWTCMEAC